MLQLRRNSKFNISKFISRKRPPIFCNQNLLRFCSSRKSSNSKYIESITKAHIVSILKEVENTLLQRYLKRYTRLQKRLFFGGASLLGIVCFGVYTFREPIKENISDEVADVATRSLGDESVVLKANEITKNVLEGITNDEHSKALVKNFIVAVLNSDMLKEKILDLLQELITNEHVQEEVTELLKRVITNLAVDEQLRRLLVTYIQTLVLDKGVMTTCQELIKKLTTDSNNRAVLETFFKNVLSSEAVTVQAMQLGKHITHSVVADEEIQREAGNALWNAGIHSVTPKWLSSSSSSP